VDQRILKGLSVFASGYVKRWMEDNYDHLMMTAPGRRLMDLDQKTRYGIEAVLYAVMAVGEHKLPENSPLQWLFKEVLVDAPPEIAKRLVNGFREDYVRNPHKSIPSQSRSFGSILEDLEADQLNSLLAWCATLTLDEGGHFRDMMPRLSKEQLVAFVRLGDAERKAFLTIFKGKPDVRPVKKEKTARSPALQAKIDAARERVQEEHRQLRERKARK
jgi:hypothetical protein